jgi:hypothetical protein
MRRRLIALALGLALTAGVAASDPGTAAASSPCAELAYGIMYHKYHDNYAYAGVLEGLYNAQC